MARLVTRLTRSRNLGQGQGQELDKILGRQPKTFFNFRWFKKQSKISNFKPKNELLTPDIIETILKKMLLLTYGTSSAQKMFTIVVLHRKV